MSQLRRLYPRIDPFVDQNEWLTQTLTVAQEHDPARGVHEALCLEVGDDESSIPKFLRAMFCVRMTY